jgi:hypothetical protein
MGLNRFNRTDEIRQDRVQTGLCRTKGTDKLMQEIKTRTSGIILDRAKRTACATQDPQDRQDYTEPIRQIGLLVLRIKRTDRNKQDH